MREQVLIVFKRPGTHETRKWTIPKKAIPTPIPIPADQKSTDSLVIPILFHNSPQ